MAKRSSSPTKLPLTQQLDQLMTSFFEDGSSKEEQLVLLQACISQLNREGFVSCGCPVMRLEFMYQLLHDLDQTLSQRKTQGETARIVSFGSGDMPYEHLMLKVYQRHYDTIELECVDKLYTASKISHFSKSSNALWRNTGANPTTNIALLKSCDDPMGDRACLQGDRDTDIFLIDSNFESRDESQTGVRDSLIHDPAARTVTFIDLISRSKYPKTSFYFHVDFEKDPALATKSVLELGETFGSRHCWANPLTNSAQPNTQKN